MAEPNEFGDQNGHSLDTSVVRSSRRIAGAKKALVPGVSLLLLAGSLFLIAQFAPPHIEDYCDAVTYWKIGQQIAQNGLWVIYERGELRTYLYPFLLSLHRAAVQQDYDSFRLFYAKWILILYTAVAACVWILLRYGFIRGHVLLWSALLANPLLLHYLPITLTESYVLLAFVLLVGLFAFWAGTASPSARQSIHHSPIILAVGMLAGALPVIRPAALPVSISAFLAVLHVAIRNQAWPRSTAEALRGAGTIITILLLFVSGFFIAVFPQITINLKHFDHASFLPAANLSGGQFYWGLENFKYGTHAVPGVRHPQLHYLTTNLIGDVTSYRDSPLSYYPRHPFYGLALILSHIYQSVNYDFLHVYVFQNEYAIISWHQLLSSLVTVLGLFGVAYVVRCYRPEILGNPLHSFLLLSLFSLTALNSLTAIETRYGMFAVAILSYFSLYFLFYVLRLLSWRQRIGVSALVLIYVGLSAWISEEFVKATGVFRIVWT